jgi:hypothetical protein
MINKNMNFFRDSTMVEDDVDLSIVDVQDILNNKNVISLAATYNSNL